MFLPIFVSSVNVTTRDILVLPVIINNQGFFTKCTGEQTGIRIISVGRLFISFYIDRLSLLIKNSMGDMSVKGTLPPAPLKRPNNNFHY